MNTNNTELPAFRRHRRLRASGTLRSLVRETEVNVGDLILPMFVQEDLVGSPFLKIIMILHRAGFN